MTVEELASHSHTIYAGYGSQEGTEIDYPLTNRNSTWSNRETTSVGGNMPHNNMEPYKVVYIFMRSA